MPELPRLMGRISLRVERSEARKEQPSLEGRALGSHALLHPPRLIFLHHLEINIVWFSFADEHVALGIHRILMQRCKFRGIQGIVNLS